MAMTTPISFHERQKRATESNDIGAITRQRKKPKTTPRPSSGRQTRSVTSAQKHAIENTNGPTKDRNASDNKPLLTLECLPPELLEKIFIYSLNLSFPHVSPYLAAVVSNERIYRLLILLAFWDNDDAFFRPGNSSQIGDAISGNPSRRGIRLFDIPYVLRPLGHDYVPLTDHERMGLQSSVLQSKWCTADRIRRLLPDLTRLILAQFFGNIRYIEEERSQWVEGMLRDEETRGFGFVTADISSDQPEQQHLGEEAEGRIRNECVYKIVTGRFVEMTCRFLDPDSQKFRTRHKLVIPILGLAEIPPSLLSADINHGGLVRGRFTDAHLAMLNTIRHSGMPELCEDCYSEINYSRRALHEGVHVALITLNPRALDILLKIDSYLIDAEMFPPYYHVPSDHFQIAAQIFIDLNNKRKNKNKFRTDAEIRKAKDDALLCFCLLLTSSADSVPHNDLVFMQFAMDVGGAFGIWLLDFIRWYPTRRRSSSLFDCHLFLMREPNTISELGRKYAEEVLPTSELFAIPAKWKSEDP